MDKDLILSEEKGEIVLYQPNDNIRLEVRLQDETVWLTQQQMAELFNTTRNNITLHIGNIFKEGELEANSVRKKSLLTALDGEKYRTSMFHVSWFMFHVSWLMAILGSWQFGVHGSRLMIHGKGFETPNWHFKIKTISDGR